MIKTHAQSNLVPLDLDKKRIRMNGKIKEICKRKGLKSKDVAELVKMSASQLSKLDTGYSIATIDQVIAIAKALDVSFLELIELPKGYGYITNASGDIIGMMELKALNDGACLK